MSACVSGACNETLRRKGDPDKGDVVEVFTIGLETVDLDEATAKANAMIASGEADAQCAQRNAERKAKLAAKVEATEEVVES